MLKETLISFIAWKWNISEEKILEYEYNIGKLAFFLFDNECIPGFGLGLCEADLEYTMLILELEEFFAIEINDDEVDNIFNIIETKIPEFEERTEFDNIYDCWNYCLQIGRIYLIDMTQYNFGDDIQEYIKERKMSPMKFNDFILTEALNINVNDPILKRVSPTKIEFTENDVLFTVEIEDTYKNGDFNTVSLVLYEGKTNDHKYIITNKHGINGKIIIDKMWSAIVIFLNDYMPSIVNLSTYDSRRVNIYSSNITTLLNRELRAYDLVVETKFNNNNKATWTLKRKDH